MSEDQNDGEPRPRRAAPPVPADVGVVAALSIEIAPFLARLKDVRKYASDRHTIVEGLCGPKLVTLIVAGPGRVASRRGAELLLAGHRPRWILSAGFAGALDPTLGRNQIIRPHEILDLEDRLTRVESCPGDPDEGPPPLTGRLLTVDSIVRTAAEKAELRERTGAVAVDMETAAVAQLCAERSVRFLSLRIISDTADVDLPPEIASILGPTGGYRVGAALGAIWKRPSSLKEMFRLREHALESSRRLGGVLASAVAQLP